MPSIKLSSSDCYYEYEDFGNDKIIVFSNSLGTDLKMWESQIDILSHHFNILRMDTRGHGKSTIKQDEVSIGELGKDVVELLDALNLDKVYFCGLSMGGLIGQWLGIHHGSRFEKIILSNTAAKIGTQESWNTRIEQVKAQGLESILDGTAERWFTAEFRNNNPDKVNEVLNAFKNNSLRGYTANCAAVRDADFRDQLHELEVPVLVISGLQDQVTTVEDGKFLARRIPVSKHISLNAAHLSSVECAEEFSKHILHFSEN
jgi:3-oxoadipate enol-lactonase